MQVAAVDLGASSGRVMVGRVGPGTLDVTQVARFPNGAVTRADGLHWDVAALRSHVLDGLAAARDFAGDEGLTSVGVDTWAVDYGLVRGGVLVAEPFHYRDERRCTVGPERVHARINQGDLYRRTGLQYLPFNTLYQLAAEEHLADADRLLLMPDLVASWLTGAQVAERTNASTTGLLDVRTGHWDRDLITTLGLGPSLFPGIVDPGARTGVIAGEAGDRTGLAGVPVVAVGSHDTASAIVGAPLEGEDAAYISSGTWGLVGLELPAPVLTDTAWMANFTNEGGVDGTTRFLTNAMGTWLLSETLRTWAGAGQRAELPEVLRAAAEVPASRVPIVDVQDPRFQPPGDMPARIESWCAEHAVASPQTQPETIRTIIESLAAAYASAIETAAGVAGRTIDTIHVVGGGSQNALLCQAIADRSGRHVLAGPVEATALGNVLIQARTAGLAGPSLADLRELVRATHDLATFTPLQ